MANKRNFKSSTPKKSDIPEGYAIDPTAGNMLRFQASLPRLPVPTLSSTVHKYLETIRPLLTDAEYAKSQATAQKFLKSPQAAQLQKRLETRAADPSLKSWLADWWNDVAYMGYRDPVVVYVSYFYVHLADPRRRDPAKRAASLIKAMLPFRELTESSVCCMSSVLFCH
jgi:carnitine O-acetyltransferase